MRRYGLLGYCQVAKSSPERHSRLEWCMRSIAENQKLVNPLVSPRRILRLLEDRAIDLGDPLDWILGHAKTVKLVLETAEALTDTALLTGLIERMRERDSYTGEDFVRFSCFMRERRNPNSCSYGPWTDQRGAAMHIISMILDGNLGGVTRSLTTQLEGQMTRGGKRVDVFRLESHFRFQSLLDCIYWLLTDAVLGRAVKKCIHCGRYFVATHGKMKYCPPRKGFRGISPCANRHRVQKSRLRKKRARAAAQPKKPGKTR